MDSQSLSQSPKYVKDSFGAFSDDDHHDDHIKRILQIAMASLSGTLISAQTAVWFGKLVLPRQTRYWYQRRHGGAPGVLRFALRQWYSCEPTASILSASDRKLLVECTRAHQLRRTVLSLVQWCLPYSWLPSRCF